MSTMLVWLQRFDADSADLSELLSLASFARFLRAEYEHWNVEEPEWLGDRIRTLHREIEARRRDALELRLKEIARQKERFLDRDEKKARLAEEEAKIQAQLAGAAGNK